jgi:hypothetical protein
MQFRRSSLGALALTILASTMTQHAQAQITKAYRVQMLDMDEARDLDDGANLVLGVKNGLAHLQSAGQTSSTPVNINWGYTTAENPLKIHNGRINGEFLHPDFGWFGMSHHVAYDYTETFLWDGQRTVNVGYLEYPFGYTTGYRLPSTIDREVAFVQAWTGQIYDIALSGSHNSRVVDTSITGVSTGWAQSGLGYDKAFRASANEKGASIEFLGNPGVNTRGNSVNNAGVVVGSTQSGSNLPSAVCFVPGQSAQILWQAGVANDVNDTGMIVGEYKESAYAVQLNPNGSTTRIIPYLVNGAAFPKLKLDTFMKVNESGTILAKGSITVNNTVTTKYFLLKP